MMTKADVERLVEDKIMKGGMGGGLYSVGFTHVLVDINDDDVSFRWFDSVLLLRNIIDL